MKNLHSIKNILTDAQKGYQIFWNSEKVKFIQTDEGIEFLHTVGNELTLWYDEGIFGPGTISWLEKIYRRNPEKFDINKVDLT